MLKWVVWFCADKTKHVRYPGCWTLLPLDWAGLAVSSSCLLGTSGILKDVYLFSNRKCITINPPVWVSDSLTCHLPVVLLQLVDLAPLGAVFLEDVDLVVVGAQGDLWGTSKKTFKYTAHQPREQLKSLTFKNRKFIHVRTEHRVIDRRSSWRKWSAQWSTEQLTGCRRTEKN